MPTFETAKVDYKSAGKLPPLEVPPDLTRPSADDRYVVPDINPKGTATYSEYSRDRSGQRSTASSNVLPSQDGTRVERAGNQRWLVVKGAPEQIWPVVKDFWQETGFIVNLEIPEAGVMETDWAESRAKLPDIGLIRGFLSKLLDQVYSTAERDKFRTRLERGAEPGTTEIYISHRGMEEVYTSSSGDNKDTRWQPRPPDPNLEAEMLRRLMVRFGVQEERAKAQLASGETAAPRATLLKGPDGGTLALNEQFDRAWRRVGLALDRVGFTVEDRDRSKGLYYVRYIDPQIDVQSKQEKGGWLSKLKFWGGTAKPKTEQFRILVKNGEPGALVNVLNKDGAQENSESAAKILALLYEQLK
ncbi:MAG: outer membrane protein assembly factor BamC [Betaproteobacteria bacterium]|nr:outer membrane protein assembly factor BamC [Betaproteobacteria bacterium]